MGLIELVEDRLFLFLRQLSYLADRSMGSSSRAWCLTLAASFIAGIILDVLVATCVRIIVVGDIVVAAILMVETSAF